MHFSRRSGRAVRGPSAERMGESVAEVLRTDLSHWLHAVAAQLCLRGSQGLAAERTGRPVNRDPMMKDRIRICRIKTRYACILRHHRRKLLAKISLLASIEEGCDLPVLLVVKHRHFSLAPPAPHHLHDG